MALLTQSHALVFAKTPEGMRIYALVGSAEKGNAYVLPDGRWAAPYVPLHLRKGGFALLKAQGRDDLVLCLNDESHSDDPNALMLFDEAGELTDAAKTQFEIVKQGMGALNATNEAVEALEKAGVLKPWDVAIKNGNELAKTKGLFAIDPEALNNLSQEAFYALKGSPMTLAYAHLFSVRNIHLLNMLLDRKAEQEEEVDLEALFGDANDTLQF